jgi:Methyltransferase domain
MARWLLGTMAQRLESLVPGHERLHYLLQLYITKSLRLYPAQFQARLSGEFRQHLQTCFAAKADRTTAPNVLELGTGWYPIAPIAFYLCGASKIWTFDIRPRLRAADVRRVLQLFIEASERGELKKALPWNHEDRIENLRKAYESDSSASAAEILRKLNINVAVGDATNTGLPKSSIDFFFSNVVLQYIGENELLAIFAEFARLAAPGAMMCHHIYLGDQNACSDPSISPFNFLRFSDTAWRLLDSPLRLQNRFRISDYRRIHQKAGWMIQSEENVQGSLDDLRKIPLANKFRQFSEGDLLTLRSVIVSRVSTNSG